MRYKVEALEGTGFVEVYDGDKSVAGPFTPDEAAAWVEAQTTAPAHAEEEASDDAPFEPVGIL